MWKITSFLLLLVGCASAHQFSNRMHPRPVGKKFDSKIVGGFDALPGQFPHQVSIQGDGGLGITPVFDHICGGSILNENWILTAAHCVIDITNYEKYRVVAGEHDLDSDEGPEQNVNIGRIIVHPLYPESPEVSPTDIALIKLAKSLELNERVKPIALPEAGSIPSGNATLSGWGYTGDNMPSILQTVDIPIVEFSVCKEYFSGSCIVADTNVCTGPIGGGTAACWGDSGSPLIQKKDGGSLEIIGIVSWGAVPCGRGGPSVYVRVSAFIEFINESISS